MLKVWHSIFLSALATAILIASQQVSAQQQQAYYVYVEPLPDYATSYAGNAIYDATNAWQDANPNIKFYKADTPEQANLVVQWIRDYGSTNGRAGEYTGHGLIQVGLGDSNCLNRWEPYSSYTVTHIAKHEIGHFLGFQHSTDPNSIMYPTVPIQYGVIDIQNNLAANYAWFVPACTENDVTSFGYSVTTTDPAYGFDVYFVPSKNELDNWSKGQQFQYYSADGCSAKGYLSFPGTCNGVAKGGGLLIITQNQLTNSLATITVKLEEQSSSSTQSQTTGLISPQQPPTSPPTTPTNPVTGVVKVDQNQYVISVEQSTQVNISGKVDNSQGGKVVLTVTKPDGTSEVLQAYVTNVGDFSTPIILDKYSPLGQYQVYANYQNSAFSSSSFNVISQETSAQSNPNPSPDQQTPSRNTVVITPNPTTPNTPSSENILQVEGTHFSVPYGITGGSVLGISADAQTKSLIIPIHTTSDGILTITLPRVLIDAKNDQQQDGPFYVLLDGKPSAIVETKTLTDRTLTIKFPNASQQIEITGTQIIPEFGSVVSLVFTLSIISLIVISKTKSLKT